eukprot:768647-Hanusia_phi.AAC.4
MEYAKSGNLQVTGGCGRGEHLRQEGSICAVDPLVYNEVGVLRYYQGCYDEVPLPSRSLSSSSWLQAAKAFEKVLELSQEDESSVWEATLFNLGWSLRRLREPLTPSAATVTARCTASTGLSSCTTSLFVALLARPVPTQPSA